MPRARKVKPRSKIKGFGHGGSVWAVLVLVAGVCMLGCVQRRMLIRSNPPGAQVYVDGYEIGATPVAHNFIYYGERKIQLVKDGCETLTVIQPVPPPWYQIPPVDFAAENLIPGEIRDERVFTYQLTPQRVVPTEQLLARAEQLRRGAQPVGLLAPGARPDSAAPPYSPGIAPQGGAAPRPGLGPPPSYPPAATPPSTQPEPIPAPPGVGGQSVHPLPPR